MPKRTVRATRAPDGHLQLLDDVELPRDVEFPVTLDVPDEAQPLRARRHVDLPIWPGKVIGHLTREELYADVG